MSTYKFNPKLTKLVQKPFKYEMSKNLQKSHAKYSTLWMKFSKPHSVEFIGRDAICMANSCQILLKSLLTGDEQIINVTGEPPHGEGVAAIAGHKTHPFLAYAEKRESPRVFLLTYPDVRFAGTLTSPFFELTKLVFSDTELLFGISGFPECSLIVWKWRSGEIMATQETDLLFNTNINIKASYTMSPIYLAQLVQHTSEMKIWEASCCGRKCILRSEHVIFDHPDPRLQITNFLWAADNTCYTIDLHGNVFRYVFESHTMKLIIGAQRGTATTTFCWYQHGLLVHSADRKIRQYLRDAKDGQTWTVSWCWDQEHEYVRMITASNRDHLIMLTKTYDVMRFDHKTRSASFLRNDEARITHFGFVPPQNETVVTLGRRRNLIMWDAKTGALIQSLVFDTDALCMAVNKRYPYAAVAFAHGWLRLYACVRRALEPLAHFHLGHVPLQRVRFFESQTLLAVANMDVGQVFLVSGTPGSKFKVLAAVTYKAQIIDYIAVGANSCLRLFMLPVTSNRYLASNRIVRYCIERHKEPTLKEYELENPKNMYVGLYVSQNRVHRDRLLYAVPFETKMLHELEVKRADTHARIVHRLKSGHMMRGMRYVFTENYVLSYGYDGIAIVRDTNMDIQHVLMAHHRFAGGVVDAAWDEHNKRCVTFGRDGLLMCNEIVGVAAAQRVSKHQALLYAQSEEMNDLFKQPTIGFHPKGIYEGLCWLEYQERKKTESERITFEKQRKHIVHTFNQIKRETIILLNHNLCGPPEERLELQDFNLNLQHKEELVRASKDTCERMRNYCERLMQDQDRITAVIKQRFWDPINTPIKNLWSIFGNFDVQSYAVLPPDRQHTELLEKITGFRSIETICSQEDIFRPWTYFTEEDKTHILMTPPKLGGEIKTVTAMMDEDETSETSIAERRDTFETQVAHFGSTVPTYIRTMDMTAYEQIEVETFLQRSFSYTISLNHQEKLRDLFNAEMELLVQQKVREMVNIVERNARLRYIISELNYFSTEQFNIEALDPEWWQDETPELITKVDNSEVGILPYISPSERAFLEAKAAEEERIRLLLMADDFKERALMKMMNGVLEIRWEDELRREIPVPKCYAEREPKDFTEDDLRAVKEYDEAVAFLNTERERYKSILIAEYAKLGNMLRDGVKKFNERMLELLVKKIQIESALINEVMRMHRMRKKGMRRLEFDEAEAEALKKISVNEHETEATQVLITSLSQYDHELKSLLDTLNAREKIVEKNFKKEFQDYSPAQLELITKLYKKRPKVNLKSITSPCTLQEMAKGMITQQASLLLFGEPLEFVKAVDLMDKFVGLPPIIDEASYMSMVRIRRLKIEMELRIRSCQLEIAEAETTQHMFETYYATYKERGQELVAHVEDIREQKIRDLLDVELQLVLKQEYVELPRTGQRSDFRDAILVNRKDVEDINALILESGAKKMKAMRNALHFRKDIQIKEWEHQKMKMVISDLEHRLVDIESMKLTKETQQFLKTRSRGENEKLVLFDNELESLRERYQRTIRQRRFECDDLKMRLDTLAAERDRLNSEIVRINLDVSEAHCHVDHDLTEKERKCVNLRIHANLKRSKMVQQIQENHNTIMMLQAELELCRLRTVPILDYKVDV